MAAVLYGFDGFEVRREVATPDGPVSLADYFATYGGAFASARRDGGTVAPVRLWHDGEGGYYHAVVTPIGPDMGAGEGSSVRGKGRTGRKRVKAPA